MKNFHSWLYIVKGSSIRKQFFFNVEPLTVQEALKEELVPLFQAVKYNKM